MAWIKFTGSQFKAFWNDTWGPASCIEDEVVRVDGVIVEDVDTAAIDDIAIVELKGGVITFDEFREGRGDGTPNTVKAEKFAREWLQRQDHVTVQVSVPRKAAMDLVEHLRGSGLHPIAIGM